jgi:hypothetical protein
MAATASAVTYDFTGTVAGSSGIYCSAGASITGSFTIDTGAGIPAQTTGTIGSITTAWSDHAFGGTAFGTTAPSSLVFAIPLSSGGVTYASSSPSAPFDTSGLPLFF